MNTGTLEFSFAGNLNAAATDLRSSDNADQSGFNALEVGTAGNRNDPFSSNPRAMAVEKILREAPFDEKPPLQVRAELDSIARKVSSLLFEKIRDERKKCGVPEKRALAAELKVRLKDAERILMHWFFYRDNKETLLAPFQWLRPRQEVMEDLRLQLELLKKKRTEELLPSQLSAHLTSAPFVVWETFHNVVMKGGQDEPRFSKIEMGRRLGYRPTSVATAVVEWENFWEEEAQKFGFEIKPDCGDGPFANVLRAMAYAKAAGWDLQRMELWLHQKFGRDPQRQYVWQVFLAVVDMDVLKGTRFEPSQRPTATALKSKIGFDGEENDLRLWEKKWTAFAVELGGAKAIRPVNDRTVEIGKRRKTGGDREEIFQMAATMGLGPKFIFQTFLERGMEEEAAVLTYLLEGVDERARVGLETMAREIAAGSGGERRIIDFAQRRLPQLAAQFGFSLKSPPSSSQKRGTNRKGGVRIRTLLDEAQEEGLTLDSFYARLQSDADLNSVWNGQATRMLAALAVFLKRGGDRAGIVDLHRREFALQMPYATFMTWWSRFDKWKEVLEK